MFDHIRQEPPTALWAVGLPMLLIGAYLLLVIRHALIFNDGTLGAVLDDTWIHIRFAESLSQGQGLSYNLGVLTSGATSPLWVLTLGAIFAVLDPPLMAQVEIALITSAVCAVLAVGAVSAFGWWVSRRAWVGLLAGVLTALTGRFIWVGLSGMETTQFTLLVILAVWSHTADQRPFGWRTGTLAALATLARPEGYLLAVLLGVDAVFIRPYLRKTRPWWPHIRQAWRGVLAYLLLAGTYPLVTLVIDGHLLPNTFRAKSSLGEAAPDLLYGYFWTPRVDHGWPLILLAGVALVSLLRRARQNTHGIAWIVWPVVFVVAVLYLGPLHYSINNGRYVAPVIPFHALLAACGVWIVAAWFRQGRVRRVMAVTLSVVLAVFVVDNGLPQGHAVARDMAQLQTMHYSAAGWLAVASQPDDLIALHDVGAIVHLTDRPVLDLVGLVSPAVISATTATRPRTCPHDVNLLRVMLNHPPRYVGIFPPVFPCMTGVNLAGFQQLFQPEAVFSISGPTVIGGGEMVFYRPLWEQWPLQTTLPDDLIPTPDAHWPGGITLAGYTLDTTGTLAVTLWWTPTGPPTADLTAFVHLIDADGTILVQSDSRPHDGIFQTDWWQAGDIIPDQRTLTLSTEHLASADALRLGWYPTSGGPPLPLATGEPFLLVPLP